MSSIISSDSNVSATNGHNEDLGFSLIGVESVNKLDVIFETHFKPRYQRNNKQSKRKNLRCFPDCHPKRHWSNGFCGRPVKVIVHKCTAPVSRVRCWGVFETLNSPEAIVPGTLVSEEEILANERSRQNPMLPWMRGTTNAGIVDFDANGFEVVRSRGHQDSSFNSIAVLINSERMGWHYSWVSHKHSCDCFHVLRLYIFVLQADGKTMICLGSHPSPVFQISCRRRQSNSQVKLYSEESLSNDRTIDQELENQIKKTKQNVERAELGHVDASQRLIWNDSMLSSLSPSGVDRGEKRKIVSDGSVEGPSSPSTGRRARALLRVLEKAVAPKAPEGV